LGQKVNPIGLRIAVNKNWRSRWFAGKKEFADLLQEDIAIRDAVHKRRKDTWISNVFLDRYANRVRVSIRTARPGLVIGRKGEDIEKLREQLGKMTKKEVYIEIDEVKNPDIDAKLVAEGIALQLERRVSHRRAMKRAIQMAMDTGADGIKVLAGGRLGGAEISRTESYKEGRVPLHTLRADIDYGTATARTVAGAIGIKVWICKKDEKAQA